jgi:hypothetical protein
MSDEMNEIWALFADDGALALDAAEAALEALGDLDGSDRDAIDPHVAASDATGLAADPSYRRIFAEMADDVIEVLSRIDCSDNDAMIEAASKELSRFAVQVDELMGQQLVLLRPLQGVLSGLRNFSGIAILSGGEVGMVVSVSRLAESGGRSDGAWAPSADWAAE